MQYSKCGRLGTFLFFGVPFIAGGGTTFFIIMIGWAIHKTDGKVDNGEGEGADDEANNCVEDGILGFLGFAGITTGGHVLDATDYDENDGDKAGDGDDAIEDSADDRFEFVATVALAARGSLDAIGDTGFVADAGGIATAISSVGWKSGSKYGNAK